MKKEIEIKMQLTSVELDILKAWLKEKSRFVRSIHHIEYYLNNPKFSFHFDRDGLKDSNDYLRIRMTEKEDSVCLKKFFPDPNVPGRHTHCDEYETEVKDGKVLLELMAQLGYTDVTIIDKIREEYMYLDFEVVIDDVKDLGTFVEIELKKDCEDVKAGHKEIKDFIKILGITKYKELYRGYVSMFWNPSIDYGEDRVI